MSVIERRGSAFNGETLGAAQTAAVIALIKRLQAQLGWNAKQTTDYLGVAKSFFHGYETGRRMKRATMIELKPLIMQMEKMAKSRDAA